MFATIDFKQFGECIKEVRKNAKYTQKYVSEHSGINIDTIRRIENGFVIPKYETLEILSSIYKFDLTKLMLKLRNLNSINKLYIEFDRVITKNDYSSSIFKEFDQSINDLNLNAQINQNEILLLKDFRHATTCICSGEAYDHDKLMKIIVDALKKVIPNFSLASFFNFCYNELEIRALLLIGLIYQDKRESSKSIPIFEFCLNYLFLSTDEDDLSSIKMKIKLYYNLSYAYYKIKDDIQSLSAANLGIKLCHQYKTHYCLELLLARKAVAELYLRDENYFHTFKTALFLLYSLEEHHQIKYLVNTTKEKYNIDLTSITSMFYK